MGAGIDVAEPSIAIIGGSGFYEMTGIEEARSVAVATPYGDPSSEILCGRISGRRVCFLARHGIGHRLLPHEINHKANFWALRFLGVRWLVSVTAVGSLREGLAPRHVVVPDQLLDRTGTAAKHTFFGEGIAAHVSFAEPYCPVLRGCLLRAAEETNSVCHDRGTYVCMNGPAFSTRAEAEFHRLIGGDLIGMTNAPEARLAREAEIAAATLALVTDYDCWKTDEEPVAVETVVENLQANRALAEQLVKLMVPLVPRDLTSPAHHALRSAIFTPPSLWPEAMKSRLAPILGETRDLDS